MKIELTTRLLPIVFLGWIALAWATGFGTQMQAQSDFSFVRWDTVSVALAPENEGDLAVVLANPWTGGLTAPQFSSGDLNFDGVADLFVFDREGDRILPFLADPENSDSDGAPVYRYAPALRSAFPSSLRNWALLSDANCDGRADLFTNSQSGIQLWYDIGSEWGEDTQPNFSEPSLNERANWGFTAGTQTLPMVCLSTDIPAIVDYDGDGDLDLITWAETSSTLYCYTGRGADPGSIGCGDTLVWDVTNRCYGMLNEASETSQLFIGDEHSCSFNVADPRSAEDMAEDDASSAIRDGLHAGGTTAAADLDGDGHIDLLLGDVSYNNLIAAYLLEAVDGQDSTASQSSIFPADLGDAPAVDVQRFPAAFPLDVDHDGDSDLLISPNAEFEVDGIHGAAWYRNDGSDAAPEWNLIRPDFLHHSMIDVGRGAYPAFTDFNADGLLDLVVANKERYLGPGNTPASLHRFENIGSADAPAFLRIDTNWLDLSVYNIESAVPCFGDLDNDGDDDLLIGDEFGMIYLFEDTAAAGQPAAYMLAAAPLEDADGVNMDVGQFASPSLIDLDGDGDLDLVVGEKNGNLNAYENTGTPTDYVFTFLTESLGEVQADNILGINGFATISWHVTDSARWLLLGNEIGRIQRYKAPDAVEFSSLDPEASWQETHDNWGGLREGGYSAPAIADLDGDGVHDLISGFRSGGLVLWRGGDFSTGLNELAWENGSIEGNTGWIAAPNPIQAGTELTLNWSSKMHAVPQDLNWRWLDFAGRTISEGRINGNAAAPEQTGTTALKLIVPDVTPGLYALSVGMQTLRIWIK